MSVVPVNSAKKDEYYLRHCIRLTYKGMAAALPNPCVGACLVVNDDVIGEGITSPYGGPHAEVNAIQSVENPALLLKATLYVTLEPCCHTGKTGPCTDLIIDSGIPKVVVGALDENPVVKGKGVQKLRDAGIEVVLADVEAASRFSNRRFLSIIKNNRPYIILKWAETLDGFIDKARAEGDTGVNWITNSETNKLTHSWRAKEQGILVGTSTVRVDNPTLTVRNTTGKNPVRVVIDRTLSLPRERNVFNQEATTIILNEKSERKEGNLLFVQINFADFFNELYRVLTAHNVWSLIVEGGRNTLDRFIEARQFDEVRILQGNKLFAEGLKSPGAHHFNTVEVPLIGDTLRFGVREGYQVQELENILNHQEEL